jgi:ATP-dependent exoDNAse (exonuclease V) beta subunit
MSVICSLGIYDRAEKRHWSYKKFSGTKWQLVKKYDRKRYLANSHRVLLTRARQGMIIYLPTGDDSDPTRPEHYYDGSYKYLLECGITEIGSD